MPKSNSRYSRPTLVSHPLHTPSIHSAPSAPSVPSALPTLSIAGPSLGQSIKQGFGFGIGSSLAHRIFGGSAPVAAAPAAPAAAAAPSEPRTPTDIEKLMYRQCMDDERDHEACKKHLGL